MSTCEHWDGTARATCAEPSTGYYLTGRCCPAHTPAALAGRPETVPDPPLTLAGLRIRAGINPQQTAPLAASRLIDDRVIARGSRRSSAHEYAEARARLGIKPIGAA